MVDLDWEWKDSWQARKVATGEEYDEPEERVKPKRGRKEGGSRKRAKLETTDGNVWGEAITQPEQSKQEFLYGVMSSTRRVNSQPELRVISGMEWVCREIVKGVAQLKRWHRGSSKPR